MSAGRAPVAANRVLVIGGGIGGMSVAIGLRKLGIEVDLIEIDPQWRVYGAGITISGPTLRAFSQLGVVDAVIERGYCADHIDLFSMQGAALGQIHTLRLAGADIPGAGGIMRPVLREILAEATLAAGVQVRLGIGFSAIDQLADQARVTFTDATSADYDLVIGADGVTSKLRELIFPHAPQPEFTGQGCWRAVVPRPEHIVRAAFFMGSDSKSGVNPVSQSEMYLFLNCSEPQPVDRDPANWPQLLAQRLEGYGGIISDIRRSLNDASRILYRPLDKLLLPSPWYRDRVVLIGDAVHATTPHLASGAGIAVEDAIVLAEEIGRTATLSDALQAFMTRRYERCRLVVENSVRLGLIEQTGGSEAEHQQLMRESVMALAAPI